MSTAIKVDERTYRSLEFAARMANTTVGQVVARLVDQASMPEPATAETSEGSSGIKVFADYGGHRTHGTFDLTTTRIDITSGQLAGRSFKTPTGAARAVVANYNPGVSPSRNGWSFWNLDDGSGRSLQSIRHL